MPASAYAHLPTEALQAQHQELLAELANLQRLERQSIYSAYRQDQRTKAKDVLATLTALEAELNQRYGITRPRSQ